MANSHDSVKHERIPTLDGWRAVAILAVFAGHLRWPAPWPAGFPDLGSWGVQIFFSLSGFLITSRLLEEYDQRGRIRWADFYVRRAFRILPPAFCVLAALAILGLVLHAIPMTVTQLVASVFFFRNYAVGAGWYTAHFWSLAVEEQFYLLWPLILCIAGVARGARAAIALACAAIVWRALDMHFDWIGRVHPILQGDIHRTDYCIGQLFLGCAVAFAWRSRRIRERLQTIVRSWWAPIIIAAQMAILSLKPPGYLPAMELLMAALPLTTAADPCGVVSRVLEAAPLVWIGRLSYSLYLWQQLFLQSAIPIRAFGAIAGAAVDFILPFFPAMASYYFIERPFIAMGRKIERRLQMRGIREGYAPRAAR